MTDIRTLLHEAAPRPLAPLDMAAVQARARSHSIRRVVAWIAGLGAVIGVAVPVGNGLLVTAGDDSSVGIVDPRPTPDPTTGTSVVVGQTPAVPHGPQEQPAPATASTAPAAGPRPTEQAPAPGAPTTTIPAGLYPRRESCSVDTVGLAYGGERSCRFTATTAGGWNWYEPAQPSPNTAQPYDPPDGIVHVTRNGRVRSYYTEVVYNPPPASPTGPRTYHIEGCSNSIIQPGDLVEVVIKNASDAWMDIRTEMGVGAGRNWSCSNPGP